MYLALIDSILGVIGLVNEWARVAMSIKEAEESGTGVVPPELIEKARAARKQAEAIMEMTP